MKRKSLSRDEGIAWVKREFIKITNKTKVEITSGTPFQCTLISSNKNNTKSLRYELKKSNTKKLTLELIT